MITYKNIEHDKFLYSVTFTTGVDAFFYNEDLAGLLNNKVEVVEVSLERINGEGMASMEIVYRVAQSIADYLTENPKAILCYWCDDMNEVPCSHKNQSILPQEYRHRLFSALFDRNTRNSRIPFVDQSLCINGNDYPMFIHVIHRKEHLQYAERVMEYVSQSYGK